MGQKWDHIPPVVRRIIERQRMYFVGTAPLAAGSHVNISPKGHCDQTFAILGDKQVAYLDLTGSGIETLSHVKENGRITFMFCSFDDSPCIVRLYGRATAHERGSAAFDELFARAFPAAAAAAAAPEAPTVEDAAAAAAAAAAPPPPEGAVHPAGHPGFAAGARAVIVADVYEASTACGYAVPLMEFKGERDTLVAWGARRGPGPMAEYRAEKNAASIDGLRGLEAAQGAGGAGGGAQEPVFAVSRGGIAMLQARLQGQGAQRAPCRPLIAPRRPARASGLRLRAGSAGAAAAGIDPGREVRETSASGGRHSSTSWWHVEAPGRDGKVHERDPQKLSKVFKLVGELIGKEKRLMIVAGFFMTAGALCELAIPHFTSKTIFAVTRGAAPEAFHRHLEMLALAALGFACFAALRGWLFGVLNNRFVQNLRSRLFAVLMREEASFHDVHEPGELTSRLTSDCYAISRCIATNVNVALRNLLQVIGGGAILVSLSPQLAGACLGVFSFLWVATVVYGAYSRHSQRVVQDVLASSNACAEEAFMSSRVVRATGTEAVEEERYGSWLRRLYDIGMRQSAAWGLYVVAGTTAHQTCVALSLLLGGSMVYQGLVTPEQLTGFIFYVQLVTGSSLAVCDQYGSIMEAIGASERVLEHLEDPPAPQIAPGHVPMAGFSGRVELRGVGFRYPNRPEVLALKDISMTLLPGRLTALVGLSGSGKSTLVALLLRLYDPTEGALLLDGRDLRELDATWFRSQIGVVSQEPKLLSLDISSNILYGCPWPATQARPSSSASCSSVWLPPPLLADVEAAAREANADEFISALPEGYDTKVTDKLLSGGQRQRIILARALLRRPRVLVLDEATSALDAESEEKVQQALDRVMQDRGRTVLVIAHRLSTVRNADRILVLDRGEIAEQGSHKELTALRGIYYSLVRRQQKGLSPSDMDLSPGYPPLMSSFEEEGYEGRDGARAAAAAAAADANGGGNGGANGGAPAAKPLPPLPGERPDATPAPEALAAAAGAAAGLGPDVVAAIARADASTAANGENQGVIIQLYNYCRPPSAQRSLLCAIMSGVLQPFARGAVTPRPNGRGSASRAPRAPLLCRAAEDEAAGGCRPARGVLILPGLGNNAADYGPLADSLRARGLAVAIAPVARIDWSRNAAALTDGNWWRGTLKPRPAVDWYLNKVEAAMDGLKREVDGAPITMLTHSAGGWLGRAYMKDFGTAGIDRFVSLGSPHAPPPAGAQGVVDQTRGILTHCSEAFPGAYHPEVKYVTVAGRYVRGVPLNGEGSLKAKFAGAGYQQVCGDAEVDGDFIVPTCAAHLEGAVNLELDGAFHSPLGSKLAYLGPWYGSDEFLGAWAGWVDGEWGALSSGEGWGSDGDDAAAAAEMVGGPLLAAARQ
ncbi:MAG: hypothetical protein J3K34DRAFT_455504 [Monoraphidium minutum]|nr:MAG: hypothetical protein J3K34DRAFT_455504 [Monoraphidium minutum]